MELFHRLPGIASACLFFCLLPSSSLRGDGEFPFTGDSGEWLAWQEGTSEVVAPEALQEAYYSYLAAPAILPSQAQARLKLLHQCESQLGPGVAIPSDFEKAKVLLQQLDSDPLDNGRCHTLLRAVLNAASTLSMGKKPSATEAALLRQKETLSWNLRVEQKEQQQRLDASGVPLSRRMRSHPSPPSKTAQQLSALDHEIAQLNLGGEVKELQVRCELQELAYRFLTQGDYDEAILAVRFYRGLFGEWDTPLRLSHEALAEIAPGDETPTLGTIESLSSQALQGIAGNISRCTLFMDGNHTLAASDELLAALTRGSRTLEVLSFPQQSKQKIQQFVQLRDALERSLVAKEYDEAMGSLPEISELASDFESAKYQAEIHAAKSLSNAHLLSARSAAQEGRTGDVMKELRIAEESWPKNPGIAPLVKEFAGSVKLKNASVEEFDELYASGQVDEIAKQHPRFEEILADQPVRHAQLKEVLDEYAMIHEGTERAMQLRTLGFKVSSWELADYLSAKYPRRKDLAALRESTLPGVEALASGLKRAAALENTQPSSALALYLQLQQHFPQSSQAKEGINRISYVLLSH
jgi:hypothetical protein